MSVQVLGMETLRSKFAAIRTAVDDAADGALADGAKAVAEEAERRAPRGPTGDLKRSLTHEKQGHLDYAVGTNLWRAHFTEFGTRFQPAQPYLFPSYEALRARIVRSMVGAKIKAALRGVAGG